MSPTGLPVDARRDRFLRARPDRRGALPDSLGQLLERGGEGFHAFVFELLSDLLHVRREDGESKNRLDGVIGGGGPTLELTTSNGSIRVLKL